MTFYYAPHVVQIPEGCHPDCPACALLPDIEWACAQVVAMRGARIRDDVIERELSKALSSRYEFPRDTILCHAMALPGAVQMN